MHRVIVQGSAAVFRDSERVVDPIVLRSLDGLVYADETFTDYIGGPSEEDRLAGALEPGGNLTFRYQPGDDLLAASTEYRTRRVLAPEELRLLVDYTMGQWSDGIGENWRCCSPDICGYSILCLTAGDGVGPNYPYVEIVSEL